MNASDQVTVAHTGIRFNGDTVTFSGGTSVGGASLNGLHRCNATANSYTATQRPKA